MTNREIALTFAEAILANHEEQTEKNVEVWRHGIVVLAQEFLKVVEHSDDKTVSNVPQT